MSSVNVASDSLRERIHRHQDQLSGNELLVAQYLLETYPQAAFDTVSSLATGAGTSARSVMRFLQKVGYSGFPELQAELRSTIERRLSSPIARFQPAKEDLAYHETVTQSLDQAAENLHSITRLHPDDVHAAAHALATAEGTVYVTGPGKAIAVATYLWWELTLLRPRTHLLHGSDFELMDQLIDVEAGDVVVVFDFRRYPAIGTTVATLARERGARVITVSDAAMSPASLNADVTLVVRTESRATFDSYAAAFVLVDALAVLALHDLPSELVTSRLSTYEALLERANVFPRR